MITQYNSTHINEKKQKIIYQSLLNEYNITIGKVDVAKILGVSISFINKCLMKGTGIPNYIRLGTSRNSQIRWNLVDIADFLSQTTKVHHC